jgi:hypothetical protein
VLAAQTIVNSRVLNQLVFICELKFTGYRPDARNNCSDDKQLNGLWKIKIDTKSDTRANKEKRCEGYVQFLVQVSTVLTVLSFKSHHFSIYMTN